MKNLNNLTNKILIATMKSVLSIALLATCATVTTIAVTSTLAEYGNNIETNTEKNQSFNLLNV